MTKLVQETAFSNERIDTNPWGACPSVNHTRTGPAPCLRMYFLMGGVGGINLREWSLDNNGGSKAYIFADFG